MSEKPFGSVSGEVRREASNASATVTEMASPRAPERAADVAQRAQEKASGVASRVQETASEFGHRASEKLSATAEYFRGHEMKDVVADLNEYVRANPTKALLGAAAMGFMAAVLIRRS